MDQAESWRRVVQIKNEVIVSLLPLIFFLGFTLLATLAN